MFLMLILLFLTTVESELHGDHVCTYNNGTLHYKTITKITKVDTKVAQCHARNSFGCIRWEYYMNVSTHENVSYMVNRHVQACCIGFYEINGKCEACEQGHYGWRCERDCGCSANSTCDSETGQCSCLPGLIGQNCDEECDVGFYGHNCSSSCDCLYSGDCQKDTGQCFQGPKGVMEHTPDSTSPPKEVSSVLYYVIIAVPAGFGLIIIILNIVFIYRCRLKKRQSERNCSQRGSREDYETIDDNFLSNDYVDMPQAEDTPVFTVTSVSFPDETYNEIHLKLHHEQHTEGPYTEVTCIIENTKHSNTSLSHSQGDKSDQCNYDTMSRSWERDINDEYTDESDYNRLEKDLKSYDTFQSVKEASSMTSLPAYLDDDYSNVNISEKGESLVSLNVGSTPP
ncbi:cell death abnormality protein 1-like [Mizuhopecten yessoensis]|uniref:Multiple epidermal growth factor-like domains protein 10 n=1 Tax=Mizuhopecten yessoensis TaxID=6573 RepID=A0A210PFX1_MIZYE|nr:cell death abnormality protein 1-like [Mizuhopecten yessoensis]OWF35390.1 Multiple epidermal growth factor-like domains protein 10 [Mizuhopecten yessoensis]